MLRELFPAEVEPRAGQRPAERVALLHILKDAEQDRGAEGRYS